MTDAELDARVEALSDVDVAELAGDGCHVLTYNRPRPIRQRLAQEVQRLRVAIRQAVAEERAACAKLADEWMPERGWVEREDAVDMLANVAEAIRARGTAEPPRGSESAQR